MLTFTLSFEPKLEYYLPAVIEWLYSKRVPRVDNLTVWDCLELLNILSIPTLENIVFQYVEQRVKQCRERFPVKNWYNYIENTAKKRPDFLKQVLQTFFINFEVKTAMQKYEAIKHIIKSQSLNANIGYLLMDIVPIQDMNLLEIRQITEENLAPQALSLLEKMDLTFSRKHDSGVDVNLSDNHGYDAIEELRSQLFDSTIGSKPVDILSLASDESFEDDSYKVEESKVIIPSNGSIRLSTSQTLKAASDKLYELLDNSLESTPKLITEPNLIDPNNSFVGGDVSLLDSGVPDENINKKPGFGFKKHKNTKSQFGQSQPNYRRPMSFLLDRRPNNFTKSVNLAHVPNLQFVPPVNTSNYKNSEYTPKRNRSQSTVNVVNTSTYTSNSENETNRRNRSYSTNPNTTEEGIAPNEFKSTYSMYNLGDPDEQESSGSKRVGIMELIKGFF